MDQGLSCLWTVILGCTQCTVHNIIYDIRYTIYDIRYTIYDIYDILRWTANCRELNKKKHDTIHIYAVPCICHTVPRRWRFWRTVVLQNLTVVPDLVMESWHAAVFSCHIHNSRSSLVIQVRWCGMFSLPVLEYLPSTRSTYYYL